LKDKEEPLGNSEIAREPRIGVGSDGAPAQHDFVDASRWNADRARKRRLAENHRFQELLHQDVAGVRV
jgi:hypothetical protein